MIISKYQAKQLQYKARSNKTSIYSTIDSPNGKIKHREFPLVSLSYDEAKDSKGNRILTNIILGSVTFTGTYDELLERIVTENSITSTYTKPELVPTDSLSVDDNSKINTPSSTMPADENPICSDTTECSQDTKATISLVHAESSHYVVEEPLDGICKSIEMDCGKDNQFSSTLECNGIPVVDNTSNTRKHLSRAELNDLRIKCATMRIASMYGEPRDSSISYIISNHPDAVEALNHLYSQDKIKPYTITEEAIRDSYPDEYAIIHGNS